MAGGERLRVGLSRVRYLLRVRLPLFGYFVVVKSRIASRTQYTVFYQTKSFLWAWKPFTGLPKRVLVVLTVPSSFLQDSASKM